ncbi:hypothetical protein H4R35_001033 [Dimargaris xerosporica]|nr:hypothetical protein H4R35_001033 [Dimargaris xerosporica]
MALKMLFSRASTSTRQLARNINTQELLDKSKVFATKTAQIASAQLGNLSRSAQSFSPKIGATIDCTMYWGRVAKEMAKQVYVKEQLAPPTTAEYYQARKQLLDMFKRENVMKLTAKDVAKGALIGIEVGGFFLVGEIIGRRNLVGYDV